MRGSATMLLRLMGGGEEDHFVIPVYQRKYSWKEENCRQLYNDLKKVVIEKRTSHFFGSMVASVIPTGSTIDYHIIDGQQRLTTVTLLLLAMRNLITQGKIIPKKQNLGEQINRFIVSRWADVDDYIKLRPVRSDRDALRKLFSASEDYDQTSNLTINYQFFYELLLKEQEIISIDELYVAIDKLEIICITLDTNDNAQLIFESLNSTGLALSEGDKIRNYILMGFPPNEQERLYENYWSKIEKCTKDDVSGFIRDYLTIKKLLAPTIGSVYPAFKTYATDTGLTMEELLEDLLRYARFYEVLLICQSGLSEPKLDKCLYRMMRLDITVTRPFLLEVLRLNQDGKLSVQEVLDVFLITENYLFRRNICEVPTYSLNKIFINLNKEICRYDGTTEQYVDKLIYTLLSKKDKGRFPDDKEFTTALAEKQVYSMKGKYKAYLFERFENYGTIETKDVYTHLDNNTYTIEHIMPQHLTPTWKEILGENYKEIHETWCHRLANLTLTGYNSTLSNKSFQEKRDAAEGGYKASGLRMNQKLATLNNWGLTELEERNKEMIACAKKIWSYPQTMYAPIEKEFDSYTLDDEDADLTGREILKYSYQNMEQPTNSWIAMFNEIVKLLHQNDKSVLLKLAYDSDDDMGLANYFSSNGENLRAFIKIDDNIYVEKNTSTALKLSILRRLFMLYHADAKDLVFYLKDQT